MPHKAAEGAATAAPPLPLARWATRRLAAFARDVGLTRLPASSPVSPSPLPSSLRAERSNPEHHARSPGLPRGFAARNDDPNTDPSPPFPLLSGATLIGERAVLNGFTIPHQNSPGGGCHMVPARDGWIALNLARPADRDLIPALLFTGLDPADMAAITASVAEWPEADLVARGREMGLAIAGLSETATAPPAETLFATPPVPPPQTTPLVLDLSALWAGPLCGHLLQRAGACVIKVENPRRPDSMRDGDPGLFGRINQAKHNVALDPAHPEDRAALIRLLERADIVIEAGRPRGLAQLGIAAEAIVRARPGQVWLTITGHGASGDAANWTGFGDDCAVAGGLSAALREAAATIGFVGDAPADPLTGIVAAHEGWNAWHSGRGGRIAFAMSGVVRRAIAEEQAFEPARWRRELELWAAATGAPFPPVLMREVVQPVRPLGADTARWLAPC